MSANAKLMFLPGDFRGDALGPPPWGEDESRWWFRLRLGEENFVGVVGGKEGEDILLRLGEG